MLCYFILEPLYTYKFAHSPERRIDRRGPAAKRRDTTSREIPFKMKRPSARGWEMLTYAAPLLAMDLSMIKKFAGVDVAAIRESGGYPAAPSSSAAASGIPGKTIHATFLAPTLHNFSWSSPLQLHRALPLEPPTSRRLLLELATAFFLYDALFFIIHILFHRIALLSAIHSPHHRHAEMHPQVTNRLSVAERLSLVLMANFALNGIGAHVLTRTLFVPLFVYLLIDVHSGLDLEWGYDKVLPWGMGAGARKHARHHREGKEGFAPFFGWWDGLAERLAW